MKKLFASVRGRKKESNAKRITLLSFLVAVGLVVSLIESMLPPPILLAPGAKLGLGNIAPLMALILLGPLGAVAVTAIKCLLGALITGGLSGLMYSAPAGLAAIIAEIALFYLLFDRMSIAMISLIGAIVFNLVQLSVAELVTGVDLAALVPPMMIAGLAAGAFTGLLTYIIVKQLPYSVYL